MTRSELLRGTGAVVLVIAIAISATTACSWSSTSKSETVDSASTVPTPSESTSPPADQPAADSQANQEFPAFWGRFRSAVLRDDTAAVATMTQFPLEVRGETDDDPPRRIGRDEFDRTLRRLLLQDSGARPEPETVRVFLQRQEEAGAGSVESDGNAARVGDFVFERDPGGWHLVRVYLREEP
jgi:hypothetical protein